MPLLFEWNEEKADSNWRKHRVTFDEAQTVFLDDLSITVPALSASVKAGFPWHILPLKPMITHDFTS